jgi:hypothetical protein
VRARGRSRCREHRQPRSSRRRLRAAAERGGGGRREGGVDRTTEEARGGSDWEGTEFHPLNSKKNNDK